MEITLDKKNSTEGLIKIKIDQADYQPKYEEKIRDYSRKANIKGFRAGKVPAGVIKKMFGKSILVEEINHMLSHKLSDYIKDNNLRIIGEPLPNREKADTINWDSQTNFEFEYEIGIAEDFKYDLSSKVKVKSYPIEVDEKIIDETISDLTKRFGKAEYPEVSEATDNLFGQLTPAEEGGFKNETAVIDITKVTKKEQAKFVGLKKGEEVSFEISKIFDKDSDVATLLDVSEDVAKKAKGKYTLKIENISRVEPAAINQELFDRVFGKDSVSDEAAFRAKVKETVSQNYKRETDYFLDHNIEDYYLKNTKVNLPEGFLKSWLKATSDGKVTDDVLTNEFDAYTRNLKWDLIKNKIAEDAKISVETDEVKVRAKEVILSQFGGAAFAEQLGDRLDAITDNYLSHENGQNFMRLYNQLRNDKIMNHIRQNITIDDKPVSVDEFKKIVQEHTH
ncbi:MAG TPA: trigger factor [Cyclobacteriaceae bacterium]|nr:trigger factor [Cyclobacteriaceae bacterium]HMV11276.1 trigger factor [Cyclobacteriaceae bacterium]HMV91331.1 trigger factor [Cyclobacteriaceae bacterium]HMX02971.1 trigger factor [Cyclobacteriaceae bacterium]HMX52036.1 trigger factor [Cyclobacteriaceae bacterium]